MALIRLINEKALLMRVANGDERAFEEIFNAYHNQLGAYVMGWTKSASTTEEIIQDVFLKIWISRSTLTDVDRFDNYLFILTRNYTFNAIRKLASERLKQKEWVKQLEYHNELLPSQQADEFLPILEKAVASLPPQQKKVYLLKREQGLKYEEIARQLHISPETARKHLNAALRNISIFAKKHLPVILWAIIHSRISEK